MQWEDIYEPEPEERDDPGQCEVCLGYFYDDEMDVIIDHEDMEMAVCLACKHTIEQEYGQQSETPC